MSKLFNPIDPNQFPNLDELSDLFEQFDAIKGFALTLHDEDAHNGEAATNDYGQRLKLRNQSGWDIEDHELTSELVIVQEFVAKNSDPSATYNALVYFLSAWEHLRARQPKLEEKYKNFEQCSRDVC